MQVTLCPHTVRENSAPAKALQTSDLSVTEVQSNQSLLKASYS